MGVVGPNRLLQVGPPWVYAARIDGQEFQDALNLQREGGGVALELDCSRMATLDQLFDAFSTVAQFPHYFGRNWPAFDECLADLQWLPASSYVFILRNPQQLLMREPDEIPTFWRIVGKVAAEWATEVNMGEWWDRPTTPFHLVLDIPSIAVASGNCGSLSVAGVEAEVLNPAPT